MTSALAWTVEDAAWLASRPALPSPPVQAALIAAAPVLRVLEGNERYTVPAVAELAGIDLAAARESLWTLLNAGVVVWEREPTAVFRLPTVSPDVPLVVASDEVAP